MDLEQDEFNRRISEAAAEYDDNALLQVAERDSWQEARFLARGGNDAGIVGSGASSSGTTELQAGKGPWGLGDQFWPVAEAMIKTWFDEHTVQGGFRKAAEEVYKQQNSSLVVSQADAFYFCQECGPPAPTKGATCNERHPGFCETDHTDTASQYKLVLSRLHSIRRAQRFVC